MALELVPGVGSPRPSDRSGRRCGMLLGAAAVDRGARTRNALRRSPRSARGAPALAAIVLVGAGRDRGRSARSPTRWPASISCRSATDERLTTTGAVAIRCRGSGLAAGPVRSFCRAVRGAAFRAAHSRPARADSHSMSRRWCCSPRCRWLCSCRLLAFGVGLVPSFRLLTAASYAAWKDIFAARCAQAVAQDLELRALSHRRRLDRDAGHARRGGPRRAQAISASTSISGPAITASTVPSRRLRTQPPSLRARASSASA